MGGLRFVDLFAGLGGFHVALSSLGHHCVFASEIDGELQSLYKRNFPGMEGKVYGDIREFRQFVPQHDILCAGFPCQPFSKSGAQLGTQDETRGTLFHEILKILEAWRPRYVLMENVGNFGRHDGGRTWKIVKSHLELLGYSVAGTEHVTPMSERDWRDLGRGPARATTVHEPSTQAGTGSGLLSPHHFGYPQHRERFYILASLDGLEDAPFPVGNKGLKTSLDDVVQGNPELSAVDLAETKLTEQQQMCIEHWNELIRKLPIDVEPPSFPLWGDELRARYGCASRAG